MSCAVIEFLTFRAGRLRRRLGERTQNRCGIYPHALRRLLPIASAALGDSSASDLCLLESMHSGSSGRQLLDTSVLDLQLEFALHAEVPGRRTLAPRCSEIATHFVDIDAGRVRGQCRRTQENSHKHDDSADLLSRWRPCASAISSSREQPSGSTSRRIRTEVPNLAAHVHPHGRSIPCDQYLSKLIIFDIPHAAVGGVGA